jgi:hypothetical protein
MKKLRTVSVMSEPYGGSRLPLFDSRRLKGLLPAGVLLLTLSRFFLSAQSLSALYFRDDEWYTLLASVKILEHGIPLFPSGLVYDSGLLYSYLEALWFLITGFNEVLGRWPSLLVSTLTIPVAYSVTRRMSRTRLAPLIVIGVILLDPMAIEWGAKARMTAMGQLGVWLLLYMGWQLGKEWQKQSMRCLFYAAAILGLLTHLILSFQVVAVGLAMMVLVLLKTGRAFLRQWRSLSWIDVIAPLLLGATFLWLWQRGFVGSVLGTMGLAEGVNPDVGLGRIGLIYQWFATTGDLRIVRLMFLFGMPGYVLALARVIKGDGWAGWKAILYLGVDFVVASALFFLASTPHRWHTNYFSSILLPPCALLMAFGAEHLLKNLDPTLLTIWREPQDRVRPITGVLLGFLLFFLLITTSLQGDPFRYLNPSMDRISYPPGHPYQQAYEYIRSNWQPGDKVMTIYMAACTLYFDHCDLYPNQTYPALIERDGKLVDVYSGTPWLASFDDIKRELDAPGKLWFVGDTAKNFDAVSLEQGMAYMEPVFQSGYVAAWRER